MTSGTKYCAGGEWRAIGFGLGLMLLAALRVSATGQDGLEGYATVLTAVQTRPHAATNEASTQPGFLGVEFKLTDSGKLVIQQVEDSSPAAKVGLRAEDIIEKLAGQTARSPAVAREKIQGLGAGATLELAVRRGTKVFQTNCELSSISRPKKLAENRGILGVQVALADDGEGLRLTSVSEDSPAAKGGMERGDILLKVDNSALLTNSGLTDALASHEAGDKVHLTYRRGDAEHQFVAELATAPAPESDLPHRTR